MTAIFFLIGCSVVLALGFLIAFFWANRTGQHEDTYTPSIRILFDDEIRDVDSTRTQPDSQTDESMFDPHPHINRDEPQKPE